MTRIGRRGEARLLSAFRAKLENAEAAIGAASGRCCNCPSHFGQRRAWAGRRCCRTCRCRCRISRRGPR